MVGAEDVLGKCSRVGGHAPRATDFVTFEQSHRVSEPQPLRETLVEEASTTRPTDLAPPASVDYHPPRGELMVDDGPVQLQCGRRRRHTSSPHLRSPPTRLGDRTSLILQCVMAPC